MKSYKTQKAELGDKVTKQGTPEGGRKCRTKF